MENGVDLYLTDGTASAQASEGADGVQVLDDLRQILAAVDERAEPQLARRLMMITQVDRAAKDALQQLTAEYIGAEDAGDAPRQGRVLAAASEFIEQLCVAYVELLRQVQTYVPGWREVRESVPMLLARALRALSMKLKWQLLRYGPVDSQFWQLLAQLWNYAEDRGLETSRVSLSDEEQTTLQREYLKPLMLAISSQETLSPEELDIAERITAWLAPLFELQRHPAKGCHFFVDIDAGGAPARFFAGTRLRGGQRFFGPAAALEKLDGVAAAIATHERLPEALQLDVSDLERVVEVLGHLTTHWGARRPGRREERKRSVALIGVVPGFDQLVERIGADRVIDLAKDPGIEIWKVENESEGGYGAVLPFTQSEWLRVGSILAVRAADGRMWSVGIVRRLAARDDQNRYIGVQLLARGARVVDVQQETGLMENDKAVLLPSHVGESVGHGEVSLLLPPGGFSTQSHLRMEFHGHGYLLEPRMLLENGTDYDLAHYRIVQRL
jgi:hypothetical protein